MFPNFTPMDPHTDIWTSCPHSYQVSTRSSRTMADSPEVPPHIPASCSTSCTSHSPACLTFSYVLNPHPTLCTYYVYIPYGFLVSTLALLYRTDTHTYLPSLILEVMKSCSYMITHRIVTSHMSSMLGTTYLTLLCLTIHPFSLSPTLGSSTSPAHGLPSP